MPPTRMAAGLPVGCLWRSRNDATPVFFFNRGNPPRRPLRLPDCESDHAASPPAEVDGGFLKHLLTHLAPPRQPGHLHLSVARGID